MEKINVKIKCPCGKEFDYPFKIKINSGDVSSSVEAYCPYCGEMVTVKINGIPYEDSKVLKSKK